jgi:4-aminobutyrate aminotransferase-like enzyme
VRISTVVDDKVLDAPECLMTLQDHLARHGIKAVSDEVKSGGCSIGHVFAEYLSEHRIDLLVMGNGRLRAFEIQGVRSGWGN